MENSESVFITEAQFISELSKYSLIFERRRTPLRTQKEVTSGDVTALSRPSLLKASVIVHRCDIIKR